MGSQGPATRASRRQLLVDAALTALLILVMMAIAYRYLGLRGKSNIWVGDGLAQHFPELYFWNQWVRGFLQDPTGGLPLWSWNLGMGADIIGTLAFPIVGDPFALLSLAFPMKNMEAALLTVYLTRVLAAGLAASAYFRVMGARALPAAVGAIVYTFTTFLLYITLRHPYFVNAMVFLPLLLIGVEWIVRGRRGWFFTAVVTLAAYANFYFFYMLTIITALYFCLRVSESSDGEGPRRWMRPALRASGHYLLGALLAAPLLVPAAMAVRGTARAQTEHAMGVLYRPWEYRLLLETLANAVTGPKETYLGIAAVGLLTLAALVASKRGPRAIRFMPLILGAFVCLPFAGAVFNGLSFPSNRFAFSIALFVGAAVAVRFSDAEAFSRREIRAMVLVLVVYGALVVGLVRPLSVQHASPLIVGTVSVLVLSRERTAARGIQGRPAELPRWAAPGWRVSGPRWIAIALVVVSVWFGATFLHDARYLDVMSTFVDRHEVLDTYEENIGSAARDLDLAPLARVTNARPIVYNSSMVQGFPGTSFYYSTMSAPLSEYRTEIANRTGWSQFSFDGFDERVMPTSLAGVEYYVTDRRRSFGVPYGFVEQGSVHDAVVYRNQYALPFGFVYPSVIDRADYLRLAPVDRQSAMLQGAVVDGSKIGSLPRVTPSSDSIVVPYKLVSAKDAEVNLEERIIVRKSPDSRIVLSADPVPDAEIYIQMTGIEDKVVLPEGSVGAKRIITGATKAKPGEPPPSEWLTQVPTVYSSGSISKTARWQTPEFAYNWGNDSQLVNLGYSESGTETITIEPQEAGRLTFDSLDVRALPMERYRHYVGQLARYPLRDIEVGANRVSGTVNADTGGVLFLSIPYSTGWTARVDGRPVEVLRVNTAFSGVRVPAGEHRVTLSYFTPGLRVGLILGAVGLIAALVFAALALMSRSRSGSGSYSDSDSESAPS